MTDATHPANRLAFEHSPYLLQHAHNPVDWHPWGEEALALAKELDKPILLSIGYATCHWCHVMAHESFEDPEVAAVLNRVFIPIKLDREERPDIDAVYMSVCQALTGHGGWPLNVFLTPDGQPFYAATYIPKGPRGNHPGLIGLALRIEETWQKSRQSLVDSASSITRQLQGLQEQRRQVAGEPLDAEIFATAYDELAASFDGRFGGFGRAPKFPSPHILCFLLRHAARKGEAGAAMMVDKTLTSMRLGGLFDHLGLGFHRYSTDQSYLLPHFEKMLYDQAMLAMAYTEAAQFFRKPLFRRTALDICAYVLRDLLLPEGAFASAEDADSEGEEGRFYVFTLDEAREILGPEADLFAKVYGFEAQGNFEDEATGKATGANIAHLARPLAATALSLGMPEHELEQAMEDCRARLFTARQRRVRPLRDDKILTDFNGLMLAALAKAAQAFDEPSLLAAARRAADFLLTAMAGPDGRLLHRYRNGQAGIDGQLDDYAFLGWGLIEIYQACFEPRYLRAAMDLCARMIEDFADPATGALFSTANHAEKLLIRPQEGFDAAIPSGNSVAALVLFSLSRLTGQSAYEEQAWRILRAFSAQMHASPQGFCQMLMALDFALGPCFDIAVVGQTGDPAANELLAVVRGEFIPAKTLLFKPLGDNPEAREDLTALAPATRDLDAMDGRPAAYVCVDAACQPPVDTPQALRKLLGLKG